MKKVFKFVKGKKDERKESGGIVPSHSGDLVSPPQTPEDEAFLGLDGTSGYDVDFGGKDKTLTKLHKAAWQGNLEKLKSALKKVEVDAVDKRNRTALHFAVAQGHPNIAWFLLGNNAKTSIADDEGHTPLLKAIECGHKDCMTLLLDRGANVNASDYSGNTGLHVAVDRSSLDTASALLKKGADTEISNNAGDYPLHIATRSENKDLVDLLLDAGASVDVLDRENRTPLMLAAKTGNCLLARVFVEHGAQLMVVDSNGWTAQDYAMLGGHESVSLFLKSFSKNAEKNSDETGKLDFIQNGSTASAGEEKAEIITDTFKSANKKCLESEADSAEKEKNEDLPESPDADSIPPYCQPPRSWEMIQAGMIDENKNRIESKRRSITALGTLRSRRESFAEVSSSSPQFTLSLNRRRGTKANNSFAKQRFSFNEEESLRGRTNEENAIRRDLESVELENMLALRDAESLGKRQATSGSDWDSVSEDKSQDSGRTAPQVSGGGDSGGVSSNASESGTFGRAGTMHGVEEVWMTCPRSSITLGADQSSGRDSEDASSEKERGFPPPPSALELGIDMAKSIKYMKGMSVDRPPGCPVNRNLWKNVRERHSLDYFEERDMMGVSKGNGAKAQGRSSSVQRDEEVIKCQNPTDRFSDVNKRISEELECYDQALRELAESAGTCEKFPSQNYYSLPFIKGGFGGESRRVCSQELACLPPDGGSHSLPFQRRSLVDDSEKSTVAAPVETSGEDAPGEKKDEKVEKKTKRHMLLAMRDVKHAVHVANTFKTSMDDQILSPLGKPEGSFDSGGEASPKTSGGDSPPDENPFFGMGRQETVLERNGRGRKSSSSGTAEESTLWLQDNARGKGRQSPDSDDDVSDLVADDRPKHRRLSSFSPLGLIQKEMEEENRASAGPQLPETASPPSEDLLCGDSGEQNEENPREPSPDISLSSGPIEPMGAEKDSGSDPESSHNDVSPTHNYALKSQHEWLKCHLKAATSEKNKLEELSAQLAEKAERLQYELADAKEAAKSRDEVIRLLQGQLARMEAAYTKSLEESVQSRLQLTSHEQEILHLKELCFRYEEEKEAAATAGDDGDVLQELRLRIKTLEGEKEKMKEEIIHLEEEKSLLEKRLKRGKSEETEMIDECQRWKERCRKLEEMGNLNDCAAYITANNGEHSRGEHRLRHQHLRLEKDFAEVNEENAVLRARIQSLTAELETERKKAMAAGAKEESISELKRKNFELESQLRKVEKEMEENLVKKLKEKEEEVEGLVRQFNRERSSLVASYERKLLEGRCGQGQGDAEEWKRGNRRLRDAVESLREQVALERTRMSASVEDAHAALKKELSLLKDEWNSVSRSIAGTRNHPRRASSLEKEDARERPEAEDSGGGAGKGEGRELSKGGVRSEIRDLMTQVNSLRMLLDEERWASATAGDPKDAGKVQGKRRSAGKEDELAWGSLYGMTAAGRRRSARSAPVSETLIKEAVINEVNEAKVRTSSGGGSTPNQLKYVPEREGETSEKVQKLEFLELKKEILALQSKMLDEKNLRHALENQMIKMNLDLTEKDNLEKEVNSLKRKVDRDCLRRSEIELLQYQKDLEAKREKYLHAGGAEVEAMDGGYRAKCEAWAKEREKAKGVSHSLAPRVAGTFDRPPAPPPPCLQLHCPRPRADLLPRQPFTPLDAATKEKLEHRLDKSIRKYAQGELRRPS